jgi:release factor glutamine methyltransferase
MPTLGEALAAARRTVDAVDARVLLCHVIDKDAAYLAAHSDTLLDPAAARAYREAVERRRAGEPVAYITGRREFYGLDFRVTPAVLIPRPDTELLVELALARIPPHQERTVLDLGTGSGCIALSIARERPHARVMAIDGSPEALKVARDNARTLAIAGVAFVEGDWFEPVADQRFDLIVTNPPYVAAGDPHLAQGDLRFEPEAALVGGADGLAAIRHIVVRAGRHLVSGGALLFEHGHDQGAACRALLAAAGFQAISTWRDLARHERVSGGSKLDGAPSQPLH